MKRKIDTDEEMPAVVVVAEASDSDEIDKDTLNYVMNCNAFILVVFLINLCVISYRLYRIEEAAILLSSTIAELQNGLVYFEGGVEFTKDAVTIIP
jgi:hypothetical protein